MKKTSKPIHSAAALSIGLASFGIAEAAPNPFQATSMEGGYRLIQLAEARCGEAKCGGSAGTEKSSEAKCGSNAAKAKVDEGKCGSDASKVKEGKCGEAKCGGSR